MNILNYNYHTHTHLCGHARGEIEAYVKRAIEGGIKHMGFSEHVPFTFPDGFRSHYRMPQEQAGTYLKELLRLRETYKNEIDIKIGFEMEYYPSHFDAMLKNARDLGAEYLILGQHYIGEEHPDGHYVLRPSEKEEDLKEYVSCVLAAIESGVFSYVAHPDIFCFTGQQAVYEREMEQLCRAAKEHNVPLEINFLGIRQDRIYPSDAFWEIAGRVGTPVTFGFDAHDIEAAFDKASYSAAEALVKKHHLNYIGMPKIIDIKKL